MKPANSSFKTSEPTRREASLTRGPDCESRSPCIQYPRRMSAAKVPVSFPQLALDTASRAHPHQLRYRQPHHQPCAGRYSRTYNCQSLTDKGAEISVLVPAILVRSSSRLDDMRRRRFADAQIEKRGNNGGVQDISRVDECFRCGVGELGETIGGLLRSDKSAARVDVERFIEIGDLEREGVIGRVGGHCTAFTDSTR